MRSADLRDEYLAAARVMTVEDARAVPRKALVTVCPAPTRIRLTDRGGTLYEPDPEGARAYVFPVMTFPDGIEAREPIMWCDGKIIDLCAVSPRTPQRWALRAGNADVIGVIEPQHDMFTVPVPVHRTPVGWLKAGCQGIVLLTRDEQEQARILRQIGVIRAEDEYHEDELLRLLSLPMPRRTSVIVK